MTRTLLFLIVLVCTAYSGPSFGQWSLLGKLGKLGGKVDVPELKKVDLPDNFKGRDSKQLTPTSDGDWLVTLDNGSRVTVSNALAQGVKLTNSIFVLRALDIPKDLNLLNKLPDEVPVYINGSNNQLFQMTRAAGKFRLRYKNLSMNVNSSGQANNAIYQLNRAMLNANSRYINITANTADILPKSRLSSRALIENVSEQGVLQALGQLRYESVVLSGTIKNGRLFSKDGQEGLSISELKRTAAERDLSLLILEADKPFSLLKKLVKQDLKDGKASSFTDTNTGDFFSRIATQNGNDVLEVSLSKTGQLQVGLQLKKTPTKKPANASSSGSDNASDLNPDASNSAASAFAINSLIKGATVYRTPTDKADDTIPFGIFTQLILSLLLGLLVLKTSNKVWNFIWSGPSKEQRAQSLVSRLIFFVNRSIFFVVFLPIFGFAIATYTAIANFLALLIKILLSPIRLLFWFLELFGLKTKAPKNTQ